MSCESSFHSEQDSSCEKQTQLQELPLPPPNHPEEEGSQDVEGKLEYLMKLATAYPQHPELLSKSLHAGLMKAFLKSYRHPKLEEATVQNKILVILSITAQIAQSNPKVKLPFSRKTALALLSFDLGEVLCGRERGKVVEILSVLLQNLSRQEKLMRKLRVSEDVKRGVLLLISRVDETSALRILLKAVKQLCQSGIAMDQRELAEVSTKIGERMDAKLANLVISFLVSAQRNQNCPQRRLKDMI